MSGHCNGCGAGFSFFKKELGCKNCGYVFCKDCLSKKAPVPRLNNEKHRVCAKCFLILTGKTKERENPAKYSPPEAYKKRIAALAEGQAQAAGLKSTNKQAQATGGAPHKKYTNMAPEDIAIAQRLENLKTKTDTKPVPSQREIEQRLDQLKSDRPPPVSEQEMAERLAILKGQDPTKANNRFVHQPDRRSEQRQVDDLLEEIYDEVEIDEGASFEAARGMSQKYVKGDNRNVPANFLNNLNRDGNCNKDYTKNILPQNYTKNILASKEKNKPSSGEHVDWNEVQGLMQQMAHEMNLDAKRAVEGLRKDNQLRERLARIKGKHSGDENQTASAADSDDEEDEEQAVKRVIKQALEEQRIEEEYGNIPPTGGTTGSQSGSLGSVPAPPTAQELGAEESSDELPWCCICNNDAILRCHGCDEDLYCNKCFREGHDTEDLRDHRTSQYTAPKEAR